MGTASFSRPPEISGPPSNGCTAGLALRMSKTAFTFAMALYFAVVAFDNVTDYGTNFQFVTHVLSMDSVPNNQNVVWRSLQSPKFHHLFYWIIILWEAAAALVCASGAFTLFRSLKSAAVFNANKTNAIFGLSIGSLLWFVAFVIVGGEWFLMWESPWSGELAAFRMFTINAFVLVFLVLPDKD
jgi:predicted small integral membrane protein